MGQVDLTKQVRVGEPVQKSHLLWSVPYDVSDAAGNAAVTVWRDVKVEEVDLAQVETKFRQEANQDRHAEIQAAVQKALEESERKHKAELQKKIRLAVEEERKRGKACPPCPPCSSKPADCEAVCQARAESCINHQDSTIVSIMLWMEQYLPLQIIPIVLLSVVALVGLNLLRHLLNFLFAPGMSTNYQTYVASEERERALQNSVTVFQSPTSTMGGMNGSLNSPLMQQQRPLTPGSSTSIFSPQQPQQRQASPAYSMGGGGGGGYEEDIYVSPDIITPRRRGNLPYGDRR